MTIWLGKKPEGRLTPLEQLQILRHNRELLRTAHAALKMDKLTRDSDVSRKCKELASQALTEAIMLQHGVFRTFRESFDERGS